MNLFFLFFIQSRIHKAFGRAGDTGFREPKRNPGRRRAGVLQRRAMRMPDARGVDGSRKLQTRTAIAWGPSRGSPRWCGGNVTAFCRHLPRILRVLVRAWSLPCGYWVEMRNKRELDGWIL